MRAASTKLLRPLSSLQAPLRGPEPTPREVTIPQPPPCNTAVPPYSPTRLRLPVPVPSAPFQHTVDLAYERYGPLAKAGQGVDAIVIIPGLFSSAELWRTLSKSMAQRLQTPVYALSLRNHGASPHTSFMSHSTMAADVLQFCRKHGLSNISLLGHSLGAKVAMALALRPDLPTDLLNNLIIGDSAPVHRPLDADVLTFLDAMHAIESRNLSTRDEAVQLLKGYTQTKLEIKFILTNLILRTPGNAADPAVPLRFRVPIDAIRRSVTAMGYFPYKPREAQWPGRILFLKGSLSEFLNPNSIAAARALFPNMEMKTLEGGHWLPFDNPKDFLASVASYLSPSLASADQ